MAQSPYINSIPNDSNWTLQSSLSDEFSGSSLDNSKWTAIDLSTQSLPFNCCNWGGNSRFIASNVSVNNGVLALRVDAPTGSPPYSFFTCCQTGGILSNNESYTYGYLEIYAKLPGFISNGVAHGDKFFPAFWSYHLEYSLPPDSCEIVRDEMDILEPSGNQYADCNLNVSGIWNETTDFNKCTQPPPPCNTYCTYKVEGQVTSANPLCSSYHKFAVEWNTDKAVYYLDDVPFFVSHDTAGNTMDPMRLVIDQQIDGSVYDFHSGQTFPDSMKIDYCHYYTLIHSGGAGCPTSTTLLNNYDLTHYSWGVKSNITFGNGSGSIALNSGDHKIFRAVNAITINGEFTVPAGAEFTAEQTPCN